MHCRQTRRQHYAAWVQHGSSGLQTKRQRWPFSLSTTQGGSTLFEDKHWQNKQTNAIWSVLWHCVEKARKPCYFKWDKVFKYDTLVSRNMLLLKYQSFKNSSISEKIWLLNPTPTSISILRLKLHWPLRDKVFIFGLSYVIFVPFVVTKLSTYDNEYQTFVSLYYQWKEVLDLISTLHETS